MELYEQLGLSSREELYRRVIYLLARKNGGALGINFSSIQDLPADAYMAVFTDIQDEAFGFEVWPKAEGDPDAILCVQDEDFRLKMLAERAAQVENARQKGKI